MSCRAVFLDRDGVLNRRRPPSYYVTKPDELEVLPGVGKAIRQLNDAGCLCVVVTNQRGIARRLMTEADLAAVHRKLEAEIAVEGAVLADIRHCPHDHRDRCRCRKPAAGMLLDLIADHDIDRANSVMIGDSPTDVAAAATAGVDAVLIGSAADVSRWEADAPRPVAVHPDLAAAVDWLLDQRSSQRPTDEREPTP